MEEEFRMMDAQIQMDKEEKRLKVSVVVTSQVINVREQKLIILPLPLLLAFFYVLPSCGGAAPMEIDLTNGRTPGDDSEQYKC